jgi:hypothetical protein
MLHLKAVPALADAALAENDDLFAATESVHDDRPLFESCPHVWMVISSREKWQSTHRIKFHAGEGKECPNPQSG